MSEHPSARPVEAAARLLNRVLSPRTGTRQPTSLLPIPGVLGRARATMQDITDPGSIGPSLEVLASELRTASERVEGGLEELLASCDYRVIRKTLTARTGAHDPRTRTIVIDAAVPEPGVVFIAAHELAHMLIRHVPQPVRASVGTATEEALCDRFALRACGKPLEAGTAVAAQTPIPGTD